MATSTVVLRGFGPSVHFKTQGNSTVRVIGKGRVTKVSLAPTTDIKFRAA